jgi:hypothetical protein
VTVEIRQTDRRGRLGGMNDGTTLPAQSPDDCLLLENVEHAKAGGVNKRPGRSVLAQLCPAAEPLCAPVVAAATDDAGALPEGRWWLRITYATGPGETDDLHSSNPEDPSPAEATIVLGPGENSIDVSVPLNLRRQTLAFTEIVCAPEDGSPSIETGLQGHLALNDPGCLSHVPPRLDIPTFRTPLEPGECVTLFRLTPGPIEVCDEAIFNDWLVYSRSPRIQDETHLGVNCEAEEVLYNRVDSLGTIREYHQDTGTFVMHGAVPLGGECIDENTLDVMMPDRCGLPIRSANVYLSRDGINFFYAGTGVSGDSVIRVLAYDETATRAPSTRVDRSAPTVLAVTVVDVVPGKCGETPVHSGIEAGLFKVRIAFVSANPAHVDDPGVSSANELLGIPGDPPPHRARQQLWPSCAAYVYLQDGEGIEVIPQTIPDTVVGWDISVERVQPFRIENFDDSGRMTDQSGGGAFESKTHAYYSGDNDKTAVQIEALVTAANAVNLDPMTCRNDPEGYDEYDNDSAIRLYGLDATDPDTRAFRPSYDDLRLQYTQRGERTLTFASSRDDVTNNRHHFWFYFDPTDPENATITHARVVLRLRVRPGKVATYDPTNKRAAVVRIWNDGTSSFEVLESGIPATRGFIERHYMVAWDASRLYRTVVGNPNANRDWFIVDVYALNSVGFDIFDVRLELFTSPPATCAPILTRDTCPGCRGPQGGGGSASPEGASAWASGDNGLTDVQVNALVTAATAEQDRPQLCLDQATGYDEYVQMSSNVSFAHVGTFTAPWRRTVTAGQIVLLPWDSYRGNRYSGLQITRVSDGHVYTYGVDYTHEPCLYDDGIITSITIPDGEVVDCEFDLPWVTDPQFSDLEDLLEDPATRGWPPAYTDICDDEVQYAYN